jgi:anti-sigma B factor antagonist
MEIEQTSQGNVTIFRLQGRLGGNDVHLFEQEVLKSLQHGAIRLLFDCSGLDYINSSGLRVLVMAYQKLHGKQGCITVCSLKDYIQEVFDISGYDQIFSIHSDCSATMQDFLSLPPES